MAQNFLTCDRDQELLLPPSLKDWLPGDHLAWFVLDAVDELDLSDFYADYREDGWGAAAHDPKMMVALFIYAYSIGVRSSRQIERRLKEDVAFRVICAGQTPDHSTIARFLERHEQAVAELFGGVLSLCARSSLVKVGVVSVDGTKIQASATHHQNRSYQQIAEEIVKEAAAIDAAEDEVYGAARGDELPEGFRTSTERRARFREAKQALEEERKAKAKPVPRDRQKRLSECKKHLEEDYELERRVAKEHEAWRKRGIAKDGSRRMTGHNMKPRPLPTEPTGKINTTDPDSRNLKTTRGFIQGYNAQAVVTSDQVVIAADISTESLDTANLEPMVADACAALEAAGVNEKPGVALAVAGYLQNDAIEAIVNRGIQTLIAPDADSRKEPRPGRRGGLYDLVRRILQTDWGKELYLRRQGSVESVFGQIKANRGVRRFQRRGRLAVLAEWRVLTAPPKTHKPHPHSPATPPNDRKRPLY